MLLTCQNIQKSFGEKVILDQVSFHIEEREKVALIGSNGAGKTTLLRIIRKEMEADEGQITLAKGAALGYLAQSQDVRSGRTIYQELLKEKQYLLDMEEKMRQMELAMKRAEGEELEKLMNAYASPTQQFERDNGYACKSEVTGVLKGLGFSEEEFHKPIANLSGGQKTRVYLGKLLLSRPDIILLDEPTSSIDVYNENLIYDAIFKKFKSSTIISSVHKLNIIDKFDYVYVFNNGRIVESGTPGALSRAGGTFAKMMKKYKNKQ